MASEKYVSDISGFNLELGQNRTVLSVYARPFEFISLTPGLVANSFFLAVQPIFNPNFEYQKIHVFDEAGYQLSDMVKNIRLSSTENIGDILSGFPQISFKYEAGTEISAGELYPVV